MCPTDTERNENTSPRLPLNTKRTTSVSDSTYLTHSPQCREANYTIKLDYSRNKFYEPLLFSLKTLLLSQDSAKKPMRRCHIVRPSVRAGSLYNAYSSMCLLYDVIIQHSEFIMIISLIGSAQASCLQQVQVDSNMKIL